MKRKLMILIIVAVLMIAAAPTQNTTAEVTVIGQLNCGTTWCEREGYGWLIYWFDTPGCARSRLFVASPSLPRDCSMKGEFVTVTGPLTYGGSGCYAIESEKVNDCFPTTSITCSNR